MFSIFKILILTALLAVLAGCGKRDIPSFSLLPDGKTFEQNKSKLNNKVDILWVVDNSGSMGDEQDELATAFDSFIQGFEAKGYDFRIAVTTTDAYRAQPGWTNNPEYARFSDGISVNSGVFVITPQTPNVRDVFMKNVKVGTVGSASERALESFKEALTNSVNTPYNFRRSDAFFAVIVVGDEDDFSTATVDSYVTWLDQYTNSSGSGRRYVVNGIVALGACGFGSARLEDIVTKTGGISASICSTSYDSILQGFEQQIATLSSEFFLDREPIVDTIRVTVDGVNVPRSSTNGWDYYAPNVSVRFYGSAIPVQGATIQITFDPMAAK